MIYGGLFHGGDPDELFFTLALILTGLIIVALTTLERKGDRDKDDDNT